jgi:iron complex outermembrane receptor protein
MVKSRNLEQAVRYTLAVVAATSASGAYAQQQSTAGAASLEEVVVTGSRLKSANETSISPITSVTAEDIQSTGLTRVEDVLNSMPMVAASQGSSYANGSDGTATLNLRNLGAKRTLVLVNGRRIGPGSADGRNYADINQIPSALIEKIDVLTGGASSVYGADAVAGVVNFVLNTKFEGVKIDAGYSFNNHKNDNGQVAPLVSARGFPLPDGTVNTGFGKDVAVLIGSNFADGRGNATFYGTYTKFAAVLQKSYDFSACSLNSPTAAGLTAGRRMSCGGSGTNATGYFQAYGNSGNSLFTKTVDPSGAFRDFNAATDLYNFGPANYFQRPSERYTAGTFLNFDVSEKVNVYADFMFSRNTSVAQIAPSGAFFLTPTIQCNNPLLTAQERAIICSPANLAAQGTTDRITMYVARRNVEGGGRQATFENNAYHVTLGTKGDISDAWSFDVYGQFGNTSIVNGNLNYLSNAKIINALQVVPDPVTGAPVCQSVLDKTDTACVPWNIWVPGGVTKAATDYLSIPLIVTGNVTQFIGSGSITGDLGKYGVQLPTANSGLQFNVGAEWRQERSEFNPDAASQAGDAAGSGGPTTPVKGAFSVREIFTEARMPFVEGKKGVESLSGEIGYRYSDYSLGFNTDTYKAGLEWSPISDLRIRGSYQRAVRAPNIGELFTPQSVGLDGTSDPCAGSAPSATLAQCARTGVTAAQYGRISTNPAAQYNGLLGGNPNLKPETADTYSFGVQYRPSFVENLFVSVDYFNIKIENVIGPIGGDTIIGNCISSGAPVFCNAVKRNAQGSLWRSDDGYIEDTNVNFGSLTAKGIDIRATYGLNAGAAGSFKFDLTGTKAIESGVRPLTGGPLYDCVGFYGSNCGVPTPKWRHVATMNWTTPVEGLDVSLRWRYMGKVTTERKSTDPQLAARFYPETADINAYNWFDLSASYAVTKTWGLRIGVNNVLDKDPPISVSGTFSTCPTGPCNGNTWAQTYDTLGRYVYMRASASF